MKFYTIEEIIVENPKSTLKVNQSKNEGKYIFFTSGVKTRFYNNFLCKGKNIFIATGGKANVSFYEGEAAYSTDCYSITTKPFVDVKFLFYILKTKIREIDKDMFKGAALKHLQKKQFKNIKIKVPTITEQQHIVAKLDMAFDEIDKKNQINFEKLKLIDKLKDCILENKLENNLIKLSDACDLIKRGISPKYLETGGIAVINQKCIRNHKIDYSKARRHDIILKKVPEERFIRKGDVLINSTGHGTLGRVAQVNQEPFEKTTVDSHVTIVRPKKELFNLGFLGNALIKIEK